MHTTAQRRRPDRSPRAFCVFLLGIFVWAVLGVPAAMGAEISFLRAYQGNLSGQTYTTTSLLNADAGSIRFSDGSNQRTFNNTTGTIHYTVNGAPHSEPGTLRARYPNGSVRIDSVAFEGTAGFRLLVLGGPYAANSSYSGSSNGIVDRLNEYIGATAPDPIQTTMRVDGDTTTSVPLGSSATIIVTVRLQSGSPLSGATVALAASPSGTSTIAPATAVSDANGVATFTVHGISTGSVTYSGTATASGTTTAVNGTVSVTYTGVPSAAESSATVPSGTAGSATSIVITVRDTDGRAVAGVAGSLGVIIGGTNAGASTAAVVDNGDGTYTVNYVPASAGTDSVSITLDGAPIGGSTYSSVVVAPTVVIVLAPGAGALPGAGEGVMFHQIVTASGGAGPYTFVVDGGALPPGLALSPEGVISGTPMQAGSYSFLVTAEDANGVTASVSYTLEVAAVMQLVVGPAAGPLASGADDASYQQTLSASGGTGPYQFAISSGALPPGLTLSSGGVLGGTPTQPGSYTFTVTVTDANGATTNATYSIEVVASSPVAIGPVAGPLTGATGGSDYNQTLTASGGTAPYRFEVSRGALPPGLTLSSGGVLSGTPTQPGSYAFTVTVTDANGATTNATYSLEVVASSPVVIGPVAGPLTGATGGSDYNQTLTALGGTAPYRFEVSSGALPPGLTLSSGGVLSGTPTQPGSYAFTVTVTDANGATASTAFAFTVEAPPRPDPTLDREVANVQAAQTQAAARFASMQTRNVRDRLDQRRSGVCGRPSLGDIRLELPVAARPSGDARASATPDAAEAIDESLQAHPRRTEEPAACGDTAAWVGGSLIAGRDRHGAIDLRQTMAGLSAGADRQFSSKLVAGAGVGYSRDRATVVASSTENRADAVGAFVYGSYRFAAPVVLDVVLGHQQLDLDSAREVGTSGLIARGSREGDQTFAAATVGYEIDRDGLLVTAYGRVEGSRTHLAAFAESGADALSLAFGKQSLEGLAGVVGVNGTHQIARSWGLVTARWFGEYAHSFSGATWAAMGYADESALPYTLRTAGYRERFLTGGLGLASEFSPGKAIGIDYGMGSSLDGRTTEKRLNVRLDVKF